MTLNDAYKSYIASRHDLRPGTVNVYNNAYRHAQRTLGEKDITEIKYSNIKNLYATLRFENGLKPRTIELLNSVLHPIFNTALRDQVINYNPVSGALHEVSRGGAWQKETRPALTIEEQKSFMSFIRTSQFKRWENLFTFFLGTGCRVGEAVALRWQDIDFEKGQINICRSATYIDGQLVDGPTKTKASNRSIPMLSEVRKALEKEQMIQILVDGCAEGYVFKNSRGKPHLPATINQTIKNIVRANNIKNPDAPLPEFTVHQLRHTFCTRLCEQETNLKVIQSVMGHSDIKTTMDVYASVTEEKKTLSFAAIDDKMIIG